MTGHNNNDNRQTPPRGTSGVLRSVRDRDRGDQTRPPSRHPGSQSTHPLLRVDGADEIIALQSIHSRTQALRRELHALWTLRRTPADSDLETATDTAAGLERHIERAIGRLQRERQHEQQQP